MRKTIVALIMLVMCASVVHAELLEPDGIGVWQLRTESNNYITYTFFRSNKWVSVGSDAKGDYEYKYGQLVIKQNITEKYRPKTIVAGTVQFRGKIMIVMGNEEWVFEKVHWIKEDKIVRALNLKDGKIVYKNKKELKTPKKKGEEKIQNSTTVETKADKFKTTSIAPEVVNNDYIKGIKLRNQLQKFLRFYCQTYENKNLTKFTGLFTADAIEKGKSFSSLLPTYRKNFEIIDSIVYNIELTKYSWQLDTKTLEIQGKFYIKWLSHSSDWKTKSGWISMGLVEHDNSYRIKRLDYDVEV